MGLVVKGEPKPFHVFGECSITGIISCQTQLDEAVRFEGQIFRHGLSEYAALQKRNDRLGENLHGVGVEPVQYSKHSGYPLSCRNTLRL